jgi:hypothetical protein
MGGTRTVAVEDLEAAGFDEQFSIVETAVESHLEGKVSNVAVVSEPFAGREVFLDYAEETFGAATGRITFEEIVTGELPEFPVAEIVLVDNCHHLYTRQIGGFDLLETFLDRVVTQDALYVTSWNRYAWTYLSAVTGVDVAFPTTINIPRIDAGQVGELLASYHGSPLPRFVEVEDRGRMRTIDIEWASRPLMGDRSVPLPRLDVNSEYLLSRFADDVELELEAVVYQQLATLSLGAPGAVTALWDRSIREGAIAPGYVNEVDEPLDIDHDEAFVLEIVLTNEDIAYERLERICKDLPIDRAIQTLLTQGVVSIDDGRVRITPERLYATVKHLAGRQLVW